LLVWIIVWVVSGVLVYAVAFAYWQCEFPCLAKENYAKDVLISLFFALFGPVCVVGVFFSTNFAKHGFKFW